MLVYGVQPDGRKFRVGDFDGCTLLLIRDENKHLYRNGIKSLEAARRVGLTAWAVDKATFDNLIKQGIRYVAVKNGGDLAFANAVDFLDHGTVRTFGKHGPQYFLNERYFKDGGEGA
jgi:hypothetical protein